MYPQIEIFGRTIGSYGLCSVVGLIVCVSVATWLAKKYRYAFDDVILMTLVICGGLLVGGHLLYGITQIRALRDILSTVGRAPAREIFGEIVNCFGGMVFYGGFLGGVIALRVYSDRSKILSRPHAMDLYAAMTPLFHTFGRIGCFLGGCCYGKEWHWGFEVSENPFNPSIVGVVRLPIQLIEAGCNLLIFSLILFLFLKNKFAGKLIYLYLLIYPPIRFLLEFYRGDEIRGMFLGLSTSQWIGAGLFLFAVGTLAGKRRKETESRSLPAGNKSGEP